MTPTIDLARARAETPGTAHVAHLNNAGAALPPAPVLEAVASHLAREAAIGGYEAADEAAPRLEAVYGAIARLLNCAPDEIALVENATRAWDMAFYAMRFRPGDRILTARAEYASNVIAFLQVARRTGAVVEPIDDDADGALDPEALRVALRRPASLVAVTHVPTNGGLVNPAAEIGALCREAGVPFLLDACQSAGQLPLDVQAIGCDMLSATGRKFLRGPRGTGFLYVRRGMIEALEPPFLDLHAASWTGERDFSVRGDARRFENWESYVAGRLGLGAAVEYALALGISPIAARTTALAARLRAELAAIPGVSVHDKGSVRCGLVTFRVRGLASVAVRDALRAEAINVSVSTASYARWDLAVRGLADLVRASPHYYNDEAELGRLVAAVARLAKGRGDPA
ncbi:MAG: aminotransferase class V-fold PLP-dependent enzyme [Acetobacteraceae bacterium]|nr:aminotransferase class V-fold PLP-dependent enzyme [Acetobacteraceae bacterium]